MDDQAPLPPEQEEYDGRELRGYEATLQWREVRGLLFVYIAALIIGTLVPWLLWHGTELQLLWIGLGISAFAEAALIWRHNLIYVSYIKTTDADGTETTFRGTPSPVRRALASPVLIVAGVVLILAGTSTSLGRGLSSAFGVAKTIYDAGEGLIAIPAAIIMIFLLVAGVLGFLGAGIYYFGKFVVRGFQPDPEAGVGGFQLAVAIGALVALALLLFTLLWSADPWLDEVLGPFRTIWGWFT